MFTGFLWSYMHQLIKYGSHEVLALLKLQQKHNVSVHSLA